MYDLVPGWLSTISNLHLVRVETEYSLLPVPDSSRDWVQFTTLYLVRVETEYSNKVAVPRCLQVEAGGKTKLQ